MVIFVLWRKSKYIIIRLILVICGFFLFVCLFIGVLFILYYYFCPLSPYLGQDALPYMHGPFTARRTIFPPTTGLIAAKHFTPPQTHKYSLSPQNYHSWISANNTAHAFYILSQRIRDAVITSLVRQNDVATSFWRNSHVFVASHVRCVISL